MDYTKLENTIKLYHYYAPRFVMWEGNPRRVISLPYEGNYFQILTDDGFLNKGAERVDIRDMMHTVVINECRLMLRPVDTMTGYEYLSFSKWMLDGNAGRVIIDGNYCEVTYPTSDFKDVEDYGFNIDEFMPIKAAMWFFQNQFNFLSLPPEIAVEVDKTNDTDI